MADDWWRDWQTGDTRPWDPDLWDAGPRPAPLPPQAAQEAVREAERIVAAPERPTQPPEPPARVIPAEPPPRPPVDPVRGLRLYLRQLREYLSEEER